MIVIMIALRLWNLVTLVSNNKMHNGILVILERVFRVLVKVNGHWYYLVEADLT